VSIEDAVGRVVRRLSDEQIDALAVTSAHSDDPTADLKGVVAGAGPAAIHDVDQLAQAWAATPDLTGAGVALALRVGLASRRDADGRRSTPVWTGPGAAGERRLTANVLHELIARATERVLLISFAAFTLSEVASDLQCAADRGCMVDVVFETEEDSAGRYDGPGVAAFAHVTGITRWRWPADKRPAGAVLHAKVLVVDGRRALVGSANLTRRALEANIEAGVVINDQHVASAIEDHVRALIASGTLAEG
jgi:phosphatidylserine/phosphatidylglycerophosphate/cardiolipin synthase-like enzyme